MITGANRLFQHAGREYHLQAEDLGLEQTCFEVRVYEAGSVLWRKRVPYAELRQPGQAREQLEEAVRSLMERTLQTVQAAIARGKL